MATDQVAQMINFIRQEASAKAAEIRAQTEALCNAEKNKLVIALTKQAKEEHDKKLAEIASRKKIQRSAVITEARLDVMRVRDDKMKELKDKAIEKLAAVAKHPKYNELIRFLIAQGLLTMQEKEVIVQFREADKAVVQKELSAAISVFQETVKAAAGVLPQVNVILSTEYLPPAPTGKPGPYCCGGVVLTARRGQIVCRNTLESRLGLSLKDLAPQVRSMLFGARPLPESAVIRIRRQEEDAVEAELEDAEESEEEPEHKGH